MVNDAPYLCIACGTEPVSKRKLAARLGVGRKRVKLANNRSINYYSVFTEIVMLRIDWRWP